MELRVDFFRSSARRRTHVSKTKQNMDQLNEIIQFLRSDSRIELKSVALSHILGKHSDSCGVAKLIRD
jgi:hypothetical protein